MKQSFTRGTSSFFYIYLFPAIILNLFFPFNQLIVEGIIIGDRGLTVHLIDIWIATQFMGGYNRDNYASFLLAAYALAAIVGAVIGFLSVGMIFRKVLRSEQFSVGTVPFILRLLGDIVLSGFAIMIAFDPVLASITHYPGSVDTSTANSLLSAYVLTGLFTGNSLFKITFPIRVFLKSRREHLALKLEMERDSKKFSGTMHWTFEETIDGPSDTVKDSATVC